MPILLIGPPGFAPIIIPGGGGSFTGPNGTPNSDGTETGPNGKLSAFPIPVSSLTPVTSIINPATGNPFPSGDITLTAPTNLTGVRVNGKIINHSTGSKLQSFKAFGIDCTSSASGPLSIADGLIQPDSPTNAYRTGIIGHGYTAVRTEVLNTVDGFGAYSVAGTGNCNVIIQNCLSHRLFADLTDSGQKNNGVSPGPSHNDGLQYQGGNNLWLLGSALLGFVDHTIGDGPGWNAGTDSSLANQREFGPNYQANSALQANATTDPIQSGFRIEGNFFDGGSPASVNLAWNNLNIKVIVDTLLNNMWGHNQGGWASDGNGNTSFAANNGGDNTYAILATTGHAQILSQFNNVYYDDLVAVNVRVA